jgi:hypothetical protein
MEPAAAIRLAERRLVADFLESKNGPESLATSINSTRASFVPTFFFKASEAHNPRYIKELLIRFLPLLSRGHEDLTPSVMRFFQLYSSLLCAISHEMANIWSDK